jgi:hypothetical protein
MEVGLMNNPINTYNINDIYTTQDNNDESEDLSLFLTNKVGDTNTIR